MQIQVNPWVTDFKVPQCLRQAMQTDMMTGGEAEATRRRALLLAQA